MSQARRVLCVTGDPALADVVRDALADVVPGVEMETTTPGSIDRDPRYSLAVVTDVDVEDPKRVVSNVHGEMPGMPILVAAQEHDGVLASDVLIAGAAAFVPLHDDDRLRDHLAQLLDGDDSVDRFFTDLIEHVGVGVGAYGRDGVITYANPAYAALLGLETQELRGRAIWDVNPDLDEDGFLGYFDSFETGETRHADAHHERADGSIVPVHTVTTQIEAGGEPRHIGTITDVTARVETQRKIEALHDVAMDLAESDTASEVHELVIEAATRILDLDSCYFMDHRGDHFMVTAYSDDGAFELERIPRDYGVVAKTYDTKVPNRVEDAQADETAEPANPDFRSGLSVAVGDHGVFQAVSKEVGAFTTDDLELAELLGTHATAALDRVAFTNAIQNERDRLAALFRNVPNPVVEYEIQDDDRTIATDVNPAFVSVFGYERDEFVGRDIDEVIVPPDDIEQARAYNQDLVAGQSITAEVRRLAADGPRDFLLDVVPLEANQENGAGYAIYTDITEQKQRERLLERQNDRLEEFASVVSHDLRNPLNVAQGRLDLAAADLEGETAEHVSHARDALDRMDALIADLLTLAREGRSLGETETVDLGAVARGAWKSMETASATLEVEGDATVRADADRVRQLFENLFRNAVEHGGPDVTVTVEGAPGWFAVSDDGPGIPPAAREQVFSSGFTTSAEGTGFGLSIVERIAAAHGWSVSLEESDAGGARFVFDVPGTE